MIAGGIEVLRLAPQPVASITIPGIGPGAVAAALLGAIPDVSFHLAANGLTAIGPPFARHHDAGGGMLDLEAGLPVEGRVPETDTIRSRSLPGGDAAVALHHGSHEGLPAAVVALRAWCAEQGRVADGGHWEYYVDEARTRLVQPLADSAIS